MQKNNRVDFTGQEIYVGLDTGKKSWKVCILTEELEHKTFSQPQIFPGISIDLGLYLF